MQKYIICLFILFQSIAKGQSDQGIIKFTYKLKVNWVSEIDRQVCLNKIKSLETQFGKSNKLIESFIESFNRDSATFSYLVKKDSVLQLIYNNNKTYPQTLSLQYGDVLYNINMDNGSKQLMSDTASLQKGLDNTIGKGKHRLDLSFKKDIKRTSKKESINGFECHKYIPLNPKHPFKGNANFWIAENYKQTENTNKLYLFNELFYENMLIVKSQDFFPEANAYHTIQLTSIDTLKHTSINYEYELFMKPKDGISWAYADLVENIQLEIKKLEKDSTLLDFSFRAIKDSSIQKVSNEVEKSSFLLIDIWGTWCVPCLKMLPKLSSLQKKYNNQLKVISLNYSDWDIEKVKKTINDYQLQWTMGYASHNLINYLNPNREYPRMILLDKNLKILLIGDPDIDLLVIEQFLDSK